jgi:thioredoxin-like negative regulator of GroEL
MTEREAQLQEEVLLGNSTQSVPAAVELVRDYLIPAGKFEEAESVLFDVAGLQLSATGHLIQLTLGELFIKMNELPRAERFLTIAARSSEDEVRAEANRLLESLKNK